MKTMAISIMHTKQRHASDVTTIAIIAVFDICTLLTLFMTSKVMITLEFKNETRNNVTPLQ